MEQGFLDKAVFSFNSSLAGCPSKFTQELLKDGYQNVIRDMKCAEGLETQDLPSFHYFKVRKLFIDKNDPNLNQIILTFIDVSDKIFAESKANRKALMLLMNTSIAQELNILINSL